MKNWLIAALAVGGIVLGVMLTKQSQSTDRQRARADAAERSVHSLDSIIDSLSTKYHVDTVRFAKWHTRWDTLTAPGTVDTIPVEQIIRVGDSTINTCTEALSTCETRVARERERADSIASALTAYKRLVKGPWVSPRIELTTTPQWTPEVAVDLSIGRGRLKGLVRAEVGDTATIRFGFSWRP